MPDSLAVQIENLSISYKINVEAKKTLKNALMRASRGERIRTKTVEAVKNLSLDVPHGSVLGIVGANGAGKSTLMRSIAGILPPTSGRILGDNIILGGLAAGMSRDEIESQTETIAQFADLPNGFIDMPVRTYSSGMYGRVAFSVAVNMTPDILLVDEALSAGDAAFKEKSFNKIRELCQEARTILIVSHALSSLNELCDQAIWMHRGQMLASGKPEEITDKYLKFLNVGELPSSYEDL